MHAELLDYNERPFDRRGGAGLHALPLGDELHIAAWSDYAEHARNAGAWAALRERFLQLCFPIREGLVGWIWATANAESVDLSARLRPLVGSVMVAPKLFVTFAISGFFAILGTRWGMATSLDARRRLKLLFAGANVSLLPLGVLFITGALTGREVGDFPAWLVLPALLLVALFPVTLAYVIVVQQAMDVRVVLRQGLQYAAYQSLPHFVRLW